MTNFDQPKDDGQVCEKETIYRAMVESGGGWFVIIFSHVVALLFFSVWTVGPIMIGLQKIGFEPNEENRMLFGMAGMFGIGLVVLALFYFDMRSYQYCKEIGITLFPEEIEIRLLGQTVRRPYSEIEEVSIGKMGEFLRHLMAVNKVANPILAAEGKRAIERKLDIKFSDGKKVTIKLFDAYFTDAGLELFVRRIDEECPGMLN